MIDQRADSILYQGQDYLLTLVDKLITNRRLGKALEKEWAKADYIIGLYEAYAVKYSLDDEDMVNAALECIIEIAGLYAYPSAPTFQMFNPPAIIAQKGDKGDKGDDGERGPAGMATDITTTITEPGVVDSFPIDSAKGVRWDYIATRDTGEQRAGTILGTWNTTGTGIDFFDNSTADIVGTTDPLSFEVMFAAGDIQLFAHITEGQWTIVLTRYFIPNNGNGTGPISDVLPYGLIYIGNAADQAQPRTMFGHATITFDGQVSISPGVITNTHIHPDANITWSKMLEHTPNKVAITDASGYITTTNLITLLELSYLQNLTGNVQAQLNGKMTDPTTTLGDIIWRDVSTVARLPIGLEGQVLGVSSGIPQWVNSTAALIETVVEIGDWAFLVGGSTKSVFANIPTSKIRGISGIVRPDSDVPLASYEGISPIGNAGSTIYLHFVSFSSDGGSGTNVGIAQPDNGVTHLTTGNFDEVPYNRGWITIKHVP
jgi:hypothetical protein